jgi:YjbE family integral membrane protein
VEALFSDFGALAAVVLIDLALAADNAVAVGLAASALPEAQRRRVIALGIGLALILRIGFALITVQLLAIKGLLLVGGLLLLWVAWRMWQDVSSHTSMAAGEALAEKGSVPARAVTFGGALMTIVVADVSMSLDNVLAVAGVARHEPVIMAFGLVLSVVMMGVAASLIARVIANFRWIAMIGIAVIVFAAVRMIWEDSHSLVPDMVPAMPSWMRLSGPGSLPGH